MRHFERHDPGRDDSRRREPTDGRVVLEPFAEGNHNYLSEDAATAAALDKALRETTVAFLVEYLK